MALGEVVSIWIVAQKYFLTLGLIPFDAWEKEKLSNDVIDCGLAIKKENGIYVCGQEDQFSWLIQRQKSGKISGEKRRSGALEKQKKPNERSYNGRSTVVQRSYNGSEPLSPSLTLSLNTKIQRESSATQSSCQNSPALKIFNIWNENRGSLPECKALSKKRNAHAMQRWREKPDENYWSDVVKRLSQSNFCNGSNDRGWKADFDFFLRPDTHLKVLEGKYDNASEKISNMNWDYVFGR